MEVSRWKLVWKWMTGGLDSVWEYALECANAQIGKLPQARLARYAELTEAASKLVAAAAASIKDGRLDKAECAALSAEGRQLASAWREARGGGSDEG